MTQTDDLSKYPWPKCGDRLLRGDGDWSRFATFRDSHHSREVEVWYGFMDACEALIDRSNWIRRNSLVYPILFCFRHALELGMKGIIASYGAAANEPEPRLIHDLLKLWQSCRRVMEYSDNGTGKDAIEAVEEIIKELHALDKSSDSFRYPANKDGTLHPLPDGIDLDNLRDTMKRVFNFFKGWDTRLSELDDDDDLADEL